MKYAQLKRLTKLNKNEKVGYRTNRYPLKMGTMDHPSIAEILKATINTFV